MSFQYEGTFSPDQGLYRSTPFASTDPSGAQNQSVLLATQLESQGARHLYPCVDDPQYKVGPGA